MKKILNSKQKRILELIQMSLEESGSSPTIRELMLEIGVKSPHAISHHIEALEKSGYIRRTGEAKRNLILTTKNSKNIFNDLVRVPLVGWTAGGEAIYSEENILDWISISSRFFRTVSDDIFLLKVKGNSMSPRIEDGDVIIVKKQYRAEPGQTIVALLGSETTVKKYLPRSDHIVLQPENIEHEPIVVFPDELRIQGIVQGVLKYY
jgi:repressor LexA